MVSEQVKLYLADHPAIEHDMWCHDYYYATYTWLYS